MPSSTPDTLGVREDAAYVAEQAQHVLIDPVALDATATALAAGAVQVPAWNAALHFTDGTWKTANYLLVLDGLNFSFWGEPRWTITYRGETLRGYWALAAALKRAIEEDCPIYDAQFMASCTIGELQQILRGDGEIPLLETRLAHLNHVGRTLLARYQGEFVHAIHACQHSAVALVRRLLRDFAVFDDVTPYRGRLIRLYKRAQILPADLYGAFGGIGPGRFDDIHELTAFADYKVPQVLEHLGIIRYAQALGDKLANHIPLERHGVEELEIRAVTIHAVELLRDALAAKGCSLNAVQLDWQLWEQGLALGGVARPYHLTRTSAY